VERIGQNLTANYEAFSTTPREGYYFSGKDFEYVPRGWVKLDSKWYPLGYRVTTLDNESLGLDHNTDILTYKLNEWVGIPKENLVADRKGRGGVWTAIKRSDAWTLQRHCLNTRGMRTKTYLAAVYNPIFSSSYRVKSEKIMLLEELK